MNHNKTLVVVALMAMFGCEGGGCDASGCGLAPLDGPYPAAERIPNATQFRLTEDGVQFIGENTAFLPTSDMVFPFPPTNVLRSVPVVGDVDLYYCVDGGCEITASAAANHLAAAPPSEVVLDTDLIVSSVDDAGGAATIPLRIRGGCTFLGCVIDTTCQVAVDTAVGEHDHIGMSVAVSFLEDPEHTLAGYTYLSPTDATLQDGGGFEGGDIEIRDCDGISGDIIEIIRTEFLSILVAQLSDAFEDVVQETLDREYCTSVTPEGCPSGSLPEDTESDAICRYPDARCVPRLLGSDGRADFGILSVGALSPSGDAPLQYVLASGGEGEAVDAGVSLFLHGGLMSTSADFTTAPRHNSCVPMIAPPAVPTIERATAFRTDGIPGSSDSTDLAYGISEAYLDHAGYALFDSGLLCFDADSPLGSVLQTGLVSVIESASSVLDYPNARTPLGLAVRPQEPAEFTVGASTGEPVVSMILPAVELDLYALPTGSAERVLTMATDLTLAFDAVADDGDVRLVLRSVSAGAATISNSDSLGETPEALAVVMAGAIDTVIRDRLGALPTIGTSTFLGFNVEVQQILPVHEDAASFVGVYADLELPPAVVPTDVPVDTILTVGEPTLNALSMAPATFGQGERNAVILTLSAVGPDSASFEFAYRLNGGPWSDWTADLVPTLDDSGLWLQGRHTIEARARVVGDSSTEDPTPAQQDLLIDVLPPTVELTEGDGSLTADASDLVSLSDVLEYRFSIDEVFGDWGLSNTVASPATDTFDRIVEVRDEAGNVATTTILGEPDDPDVGMDVGVDASDVGADASDVGADASDVGVDAADVGDTGSTMDVGEEDATEDSGTELEDTAPGDGGTGDAEQDGSPQTSGTASRGCGGCATAHRTSPWDGAPPAILLFVACGIIRKRRTV